jgi:2-(1,2-epoxy-1,2-dihydrophenyl)acetyl-CoA isomerase
MSDQVLLAEADGVATLTLNRPEKLNAFADDMREQFVAAIEAVARRPGVRVLLVTGAGRAFCAGGDVDTMVALKERGAAFEGGLSTLVDAGAAAISRLVSLPFPTVACVNGPAAGGGTNLALACDLRIASDRASFGQSFVRIGLHTDWGGTFFLPRLVGVAKALELCWLGDMIDAAEALRLGLVNRVVPHERLAEETRALVTRLASAPWASVRETKRNLRASAHRTLDECLTAEHEAQAACWGSADSDEGVRAFVEKRPARFARQASNRESSAPRLVRTFE